MCLTESFDSFTCGPVPQSNPPAQFSVFGGAGTLFFPLDGAFNAYQQLNCDHFFNDGCDSDSLPAYTGIRASCQFLTGACNIVFDFASPQSGPFTVGYLAARTNNVVTFTANLAGSPVSTMTTTPSTACGVFQSNVVFTTTGLFDQIAINGAEVIIDDAKVCNNQCVKQFTGGSDGCNTVPADVCLACTNYFGETFYSIIHCNDTSCDHCYRKFYSDAACTTFVRQSLVLHNLCSLLELLFPTANSVCAYTIDAAGLARAHDEL